MSAVAGFNAADLLVGRHAQGSTADKVAVRRAAFRAHAASVERVRASSVEIVTDAQVTALEGGHRVEKAVVRVKGEDVPRHLPRQQVVAALADTTHDVPAA